MNLQNKLAAQQISNYSNFNELTHDLSSFDFEKGLDEYDYPYLDIRKRSHAMAVVSSSHAVFLVSLINKFRHLAAEEQTLQSSLPSNNKYKSRNPIKVGLIGCGRLGRHVVSSLLHFADVRPDELLVSSRQPSKLASLKNAKIECFYDNRRVAQQCDVIFLCFTPTSLISVADEVRDHINPNSLIFSFLSATSTQKLRKMFSHDQLYRMILDWFPDHSGRSWNVGSDVITSLLDASILQLCCPTSERLEEEAIVKPPFETVEVTFYYIINNLFQINVNDKIILKLIEKVFFQNEVEIDWEDILSESDLNQLKLNCKIQIDINEILSEESVFKKFIYKRCDLNQVLTKVFLSAFQDNSSKKLN